MQNQNTDSKIKIAFQTVAACMTALVGADHVHGMHAAGHLYTYTVARLGK